MLSEFGKNHLIEIVRERYAEEGDYYYWYILNVAGVLNISKEAREIHTISLTQLNNIRRKEGKSNIDIKEGIDYYEMIEALENQEEEGWIDKI